ncbi:MAG: thioredoxin fold domain-containing protein [Sphingobacteriales bacterium]
MKRLLFIVFILTASFARSQSKDSIQAPYLQDKKLPFFKMMLTDSSIFYKNDLKKNQPAIIIFFSPECEHCKKLTESLIESINEFKKTQIVMISPLPLSKIKEFYDEQQIKKYRSIKMGKDALYFFANYFQTHYLPFIATYNKKGELVKGWEGGTTIKELLESLK